MHLLTRVQPWFFGFGKIAGRQVRLQESTEENVGEEQVEEWEGLLLTLGRDGRQLYPMDHHDEDQMMEVVRVRGLIMTSPDLYRERMLTGPNRTSFNVDHSFHSTDGSVAQTASISWSVGTVERRHFMKCTAGLQRNLENISDNDEEKQRF